MSFLKWVVTIMVAMAIVFVLGPKPDPVAIDNTPVTLDRPLDQLEAFISQKESQVKYLKPGNAAEIVWADSVQQQTPYSLIYLHGFSASHEEGAPLHREIAKKHGMNLYLARLEGHGTAEPEPFKNLTVKGMMASAKEAIAIGKLLGEKVIIMSCSTGGTFSLYLSANDPAIAAQILYSPNIDLYDKTSGILTMPWGLQLARLISGGDSYTFDPPEEMKKYWTTTYRIEGLVALKQLLTETMTKETFSAIEHPVFIGYYYKNEEEQDKVISTELVKEMVGQLATPKEQKRMIAFPDVGYHAMNSKYRSLDLESVREETIKFLEEVMKLSPTAR